MSEQRAECPEGHVILWLTDRAGVCPCGPWTQDAKGFLSRRWIRSEMDEIVSEFYRRYQAARAVADETVRWLNAMTREELSLAAAGMKYAAEEYIQLTSTQAEVKNDE